jgi:membrane protease YdiL (CAAX protease family)
MAVKDAISCGRGREMTYRAQSMARTATGALLVALLMAAAFRLLPDYAHRWWPQLPLHWALKPILLPALALLLLRRRLPEIRFQPQQWPHLLFVVGCVALAVLAFGKLGFDETYSNWRLALPIAALFAIGVPLAQRLGAVRGGTALSIGWYFGPCLIALCVWPAWLSAVPVTPLGNMVMNFLFIGMAEELAFRGVIYGYLQPRLPGRFVGISHVNWITAALFAWVHNVSLAPDHWPWLSFTFAMGLLFGVLREKTGNWLIPGIGHGSMIPLLQAFAALGLLELPGG